MTEDAHTALRLHRAGWHSAYPKLPLAAGLATERLAIHVGQRMRWARGMTQIFRLDNPFLGRGLSFGQRICYMNAMMHFFFGVPRFVFLTAPLAYLMFRLNIIAASGLMVIAYALPHLWHSTVTNSRLQSRYRHSFWGEIYESVLAMYLLKPTLTTLINPKRGKFNVTEKGGLLPADYFDYKIVRPHLVITFLLVAGVIIGLVRWWFTDYSDTEVLLLNVFWAIFNLVTISAAIAVAREARQLRGAVRHELVLPVVVHLPNGRTIATQSDNISTTGAQLAVPLTAGTAARRCCRDRAADGRELDGGAGRGGGHPQPAAGHVHRDDAAPETRHRAGRALPGRCLARLGGPPGRRADPLGRPDFQHDHRHVPAHPAAAAAHRAAGAGIPPGRTTPGGTGGAAARGGA